ncbi:MAG: aspartyl protease [Planctomycetes bacterium]|nr:aspartyl protease [Planctomycetota bacterium]
MGLTHVTATVINPARPGRKAKLSFLVDSGAIYTVAPGEVLDRLGIKPHGSRTFVLADGTHVTRKIGDAIFAIDGERAASPVVFGEKGDSQLFGTVSLEALGFVLDPIRRELRRLPMLLG